MIDGISSIQLNISKGDAAIKNRANYSSALNFYLEAAQHVVSLNWHLPVRQKIRSIFLGDINGDGYDELLFGTEGHFVVACHAQSIDNKSEPKKIWEFKANDWVTSIAAVDVNEDGIDEIVVASDKIYVLDRDGNCINEYASEHPISAMQTFSDNQGNNIIVVGDNHGNIKCYDFQFCEVWTLPFTAKGKIIDICIGDFDGDGKVEVAAASEDKFVYIINDVGEEKDKVNVRHWIVNLADCKMKNNKLRLFVGKFTGDTLVYKHKQTSQAVALKQSGILDLKVEYLFDDDQPQFIVGSSDRCLSIFNYSGELIWAFESGLGQRAISIKRIASGEIEIFVGTESGDVYSYTIRIVKDLVGKIKNAYEKSGIIDLLDLRIEPSKLKILRNYIEYNPIKHTASLASLNDVTDFQSAIISAMEVWFNNCNFIWEYKTNGRIYDLVYALSEQQKVLLVGSDDGTLYCLDHDGKPLWKFNSQNDLKGIAQGIRGVFAIEENIFTASVDKSLYCLNWNGEPEWIFCHEDWILFTSAGLLSNTKQISIFAGTEDGFVLAFDNRGLLTWKVKLRERVRALSVCERNNSEAFVIAGSDDNHVYIINKNGKIVNSFCTPHYVLVVKAYDIDNDGRLEILTGNEDGHLHVYDFYGNLLWRFDTESWVAALDVFKNKDNGEVEIVIGSQDNNIYVLNKYGALLWQYEGNARVRTISADDESNRIAFGSYDYSAYTLEQVNREVVFNALKELLYKYCLSGRIQELANSESRYSRAFAYLFTEDFDLLQIGLNDKSDIVIAAIGSNLIENFLPQNKYAKILTNLLINATRRVKAVLLCKLTESLKAKKIKMITVVCILNAVITTATSATEKIDVFRYWLTITENCDDILRLTERLIPQNATIIDDFLIDEINRACLVAINKSSGDSGDFTTIARVNRIAKVIETKYADTAKRLLETF